MKSTGKMRLLGAAVLATAFSGGAMAQATDAPATSFVPRQHGPMHLHATHDNGTADSTNWSGYAVTGSSFTQAAGSWVVPTVNCLTTPNTYAAFWVGLDGYSSSTVEQTGTGVECIGKTAYYYAWYEFYPANSILISSVPVAPGNKISASVTYSGMEFTTTITNVTTGRSYSKSSVVPGAARSSAEWIAEAPCCTNSGGVLPLSAFGTASFGMDYTSVTKTNEATDKISGGAVPISSFGTSNWQMINMVSASGAAEATTSVLSTDGTSFTVAWKSE
jgi:hypothetical protein